MDGQLNGKPFLCPCHSVYICANATGTACMLLSIKVHVWQYCVAHGGGRRCEHDNCSKVAQSGTKLCVAHGGGRRCQTDGCQKSARHGALFILNSLDCG